MAIAGLLGVFGVLGRGQDAPGAGGQGLLREPAAVGVLAFETDEQSPRACGARIDRGTLRA